MSQAGYLRQWGDLYQVTEAGMRALGLDPDAVPEPQTTAEILETWRQALRLRAMEMLEILVGAHPAGLSRDDRRRRLGLTAGSGTFGGYVTELVRNGLATGEHGHLTAASVLFPLEEA